MQKVSLDYNYQWKIMWNSKNSRWWLNSNIMNMWTIKKINKKWENALIILKPIILIMIRKNLDPKVLKILVIGKMLPLLLDQIKIVENISKIMVKFRSINKITRILWNYRKYQEKFSKTFHKEIWTI